MCRQAWQRQRVTFSRLRGGSYVRIDDDGLPVTDDAEATMVVVAYHDDFRVVIGWVHGDRLARLRVGQQVDAVSAVRDLSTTLAALRDADFVDAHENQDPGRGDLGRPRPARWWRRRGSRPCR